MAKCNDCELCTQGLLGAVHKATVGGPSTVSMLPPAVAAPFLKKCPKCFHTMAEHQAFKVQIAVLVAQQAQAAAVAVPPPVLQAAPAPPRSRCEHCGASFPEARKCPECGANAVLDTGVRPTAAPPPPSAAPPAPSTGAAVAAVVAAPVALLAASAAALNKGGVPWHKRMVVVITALVIFAPLGIALVWAHKLWSQRTRILVTIASGGFFVTAMIGGQLDKRAKERAKAAAAAKQADARGPAPASGTGQPSRVDEPARQEALPPATAPSPPPDAAMPADEQAPGADAGVPSQVGAPGAAEDSQAERQRLKSRRFVDVTPEALARKMLEIDDLAAAWKAKYLGRYVKWKGTFERKGVIVDFVASGGRVSAFSCKDFDAAHAPGAFEGVETGDAIRVEGKLDGLQQQLGKEKVEFILTECIATKR